MATECIWVHWMELKPTKPTFIYYNIILKENPPQTNCTHTHHKRTKEEITTNTNTVGLDGGGRKKVQVVDSNTTFSFKNFLSDTNIMMWLKENLPYHHTPHCLLLMVRCGSDLVWWYVRFCWSVVFGRVSLTSSTAPEEYSQIIWVWSAANKREFSVTEPPDIYLIKWLSFAWISFSLHTAQ